MPHKERPVTYLGRGTHNIEKERYIFISHSPADDEWVLPILNGLHDAGVNYWYDRSVDPGDEWDKKVLKKIEDDKCVGAVFFLSPNLINSETVAKEVRVVQEKIRAAQGRHKDFICFSINKDNRSLAKQVKDYYLKQVDEDYLKEKTAENKSEKLVEILQLHRILLLAQLFPGNKVFPDEGAISTGERKHFKTNKDEEYARIDQGDLSPGTERFKMVLGMLKKVGAASNAGSLMQVLEKEKLVEMDGRAGIVCFGSCKGVTRGNRTYSMDQIRWIVLHTDAKSVTMISERLLDAGDFDRARERLKSLSRVLSHYLKEPPRLLREYEYVELKNTGHILASATKYAKLAKDYANEDWWMEGHKTVDGKELMVPTDEHKVCCIRPVITIAVDKLREWKKEHDKV